ncbi:hypothetical protein NPIL_216981 [Nephila pilipes]|uniref:Uncharacterized protein n=1 Tax=Nephila pilipes TaxID=299642 RepID=A0A8X6MNY4_NEPPI|nr:hypothetical protein NPIL_216981 [Nephila pilipes]
MFLGETLIYGLHPTSVHFGRDLWFGSKRQNLSGVFAGHRKIGRARHGTAHCILLNNYRASASASASAASFWITYHTYHWFGLGMGWFADQQSNG